MPLRLSESRTFTTTATDAAGDSFTATFRILPDDEIKAIFDADGTMADLERAFLIRVTESLGDLLDADGAPLPYNPALLDEVLAQSDLRVGLLRAYQAGIAGRKAGN